MWTVEAALIVCICIGTAGVCEAEDLWQVWTAADAGGRSLPPNLPLEIRLR